MMAPVFAHGQLRLYLLSLLESGPKHGYELITALSDRFGGTYRPSPGTVYPRLARLEEEGLVRRVDDERKSIYSLTDAGRAELAARSDDLAHLEEGIAETVRERAEEVRADVPDDSRLASHVRSKDAEAMIQRFRDEIRADLRRADARGAVEQLTLDTLRTVLDSALTAVRGTLR